MNKIEVVYVEWLCVFQVVGEVQWYWFEGMKFWLVDNMFYMLDFVVMVVDGVMECYEVKGYW